MTICRLSFFFVQVADADDKRFSLAKLFLNFDNHAHTDTDMD
jgi:hypothetical protein